MKTVIANFKSNKNRQEIREWVTQFSFSSETIKVVVCPPASLLTECEPITEKSAFLGVQDLSNFPAGAYTGAISTKNLEGFAISYAIVGHSERRRYFHETAAEIANKIRECLSAGIQPIVCVTKDEINATANALSETERSACLVAFEPIEHIGTGTSDTLENILETKQWLKTAFGDVPYIYGGSVHAKTDPSILTSPEIDGFLVGTASLDAVGFCDLLKLCS